MMSRKQIKSAGLCGIGVGIQTHWWAVCLFPVAAALGQTEAAVIAQGEVVANDVYVRSGPSMNYYPIGKLQAGDRVQIVSEREPWYEILPPTGMFSLIHEDYVDTVDGKVGVVNGNNVLVRAGSSLPEWSKQKYARQAKLSKGAKVRILGKNPEGYMRIEPPNGVTAWIHRTLIHPIPENLVPLEQQASPPVVTATSALDQSMTESGSVPPANTVTRITGNKVRAKSDAASALSALPTTKNRKTLIEIDEAIKVELKKPVLERNLAPLQKRYRQIAEEDGDELATEYARARLDQLEHMVALIDAVKNMRKLDEQIEVQRVKFMEERAANRYASLPPVQAGLDAQGELRTSALYPPGSKPRRFRLVEPATGRTIGYVELPPDSTVDVDSFIGRYVGVRASQKRLLAGGVNPVPIYVARELVLLLPTSGSDGPS